MNDTTVDPLPQWRLGYGLGAPIAAWAVHGLTSVLLTLNACRPSGGALEPGTTRGLLIALTLVALAVTVSGIWVAFGSWRRLTQQRRFLKAESEPAQQMLAQTGIFAGVLFSIGIFWGGLPTLVLNVCESVR
jgi:hypothetical protein